MDRASASSSLPSTLIAWASAVQRPNPSVFSCRYLSYVTSCVRTQRAKPLVSPDSRGICLVLIFSTCRYSRNLDILYSIGTLIYLSYTLDFLLEKIDWPPTLIKNPPPGQPVLLHRGLIRELTKLGYTKELCLLIPGWLIVNLGFSNFSCKFHMSGVWNKWVQICLSNLFWSGESNTRSIQLKQSARSVTNIRRYHWLGDSSFSAQFTVKNVVCFSDIFHWKS
jgi:hypothetical protein